MWEEPSCFALALRSKPQHLWQQRHWVGNEGPWTLASAFCQRRENDTSSLFFFCFFKNISRSYILLAVSKHPSWVFFFHNLKPLMSGLYKLSAGKWNASIHPSSLFRLFFLLPLCTKKFLQTPFCSWGCRSEVTGQIGRVFIIFFFFFHRHGLEERYKSKVSHRFGCEPDARHAPPSVFATLG